jgi:hypothetical protein
MLKSIAETHNTDLNTVDMNTNDSELDVHNTEILEDCVKGTISTIYDDTNSSSVVEINGSNDVNQRVMSVLHYLIDTNSRFDTLQLKASAQS